MILKVLTLFSTRCSFELYHKTDCSGLKLESYYAMTLKNVRGLFSGLRLSSVGVYHMSLNWKMDLYQMVQNFIARLMMRLLLSLVEVEIKYSMNKNFPYNFINTG